MFESLRNLPAYPLITEKLRATNNIAAENDDFLPLLLLLFEKNELMRAIVCMLLA